MIPSRRPTTGTPVGPVGDQDALAGDLAPQLVERLGVEFEAQTVAGVAAPIVVDAHHLFDVLSAQDTQGLRAGSA